MIKIEWFSEQRKREITAQAMNLFYGPPETLEQVQLSKEFFFKERLLWFESIEPNFLEALRTTMIQIAKDFGKDITTDVDADAIRLDKAKQKADSIMAELGFADLVFLKERTIAGCIERLNKKIHSEIPYSMVPDQISICALVPSFFASAVATLFFFSWQGYFVSLAVALFFGLVAATLATRKHRLSVIIKVALAVEFGLFAALLLIEPLIGK